MTTAISRREPRSVGWAYALWIPSLLGVCGLHRFYSGRYISGLVWLLTYGLCGVGTAIDLFFVPRMIDDHNEGRTVW